MMFIGIGFPIMIFGAITWVIGEAGANSVFPEIGQLGAGMFSFGIILFFIGVVLVFVSCWAGKKYENKEINKSNDQPFIPPLLGIDSSFYTVYQKCESCGLDGYCAEYEGKEICKKCFLAKSGFVANE